MAAFVGEERRRVVAELSARYDACGRASSPHLACVIAEAGWGKTRIVQELYAWLQRERQPGESYWPADLAPSQVDPMRSRKIIYPERVDAFPDTPIPWLWWGLRCEEDSGGRKVHALLNDGVQMRAHLAALIRAATSRAEDRDLAASMIGEAIGFVPGLGQIATVAIAATSLLPRVRKRLVAAIARGQGRQTRMARTIDLARTDQPDIEAQLALVRQFVSRELPLVLAIDDAHTADPGTTEFVRGLMRIPAPILIIGTAWPSALADQIAEERGCEPAHRTSFGSMLEQLTAERPDAVSRIALDPLSDGALEELVREVAPATSAERRRTLIEASGSNPLVLQLQVTSPKVLRSIVDDAITLSADELEQLPRGFERLIGERFDDLPQDDRRWLAEAALQGDEFLPGVMTAPIGSIDRERIGAFVRLPAEGGTVAGRFIEPPVRRAILAAAEADYTAEERTEWELETLARLVDGPDLREDAESTRRRLLVRLAERHPDSVAAPRAVANAAWLQSFDERNRGGHRQELVAAEAAVRWAERAASDEPTRARMLARLSSALQANNERVQAVERAREAVHLLERAPGSDREDLSDALHVLAAALAQNDDPGARDAARKACEYATERLSRIYSLNLLAEIENDENETEAARATLAKALELAEALDPPDIEEVIRLETAITDLDPHLGSIERWEEHLNAVEERLGVHHPLYRYCLLSLAWPLVLRGDFARAEATLQQLADVADGEEETITALRSLIALFETGDVMGASTAIAELAETPYLNLGAARRLHAVLGAISGQGVEESDLDGPLGALSPAHGGIDGAIEWLAAQCRLGGSDWSLEEQMLAVQIGAALLSDGLLTSGRPAPASDRLVSALTAFLEGAEDPPLLVTQPLTIYREAQSILEGHAPPPIGDRFAPVIALRARLLRAVAAHARGDEPQCEELLAEARAAVASSDRSLLWRLLGYAHSSCGSPYTEHCWRTAASLPGAPAAERLHARAGLGLALWRQGRLAEAEVEERAVLEGRRQAFGAEDPGTVSAATNLAFTLKGLNRLGEARDLQRAALQAMARRLGEAHAQTIGGKVELANTLFELGELVDARELARSAAETYAQTLGPDHVLAVDARALHARVLQQAGEPRAAASLLEQVVAWRRRELGDADDETLDAMASRAEALRAAGEAEPARDLAAEVLRIRAQNAPADDPAVIAAKSALAAATSSAGDLSGAADLQREVLASSSRLYGANADQTLAEMAALATTLYLQRDLEGALALEQNVLAARRFTLRQAQLNCHGAADNLAYTLWELRDPHNAIALKSMALTDLAAALGADAPDTLAAKSRLAQWYFVTGSLETARELLVAVRDGRERLLGPDAPLTRESVAELEAVEAALAEHTRRAADDQLEAASP